MRFETRSQLAACVRDTNCSRALEQGRSLCVMENRLCAELIHSLIKQSRCLLSAWQYIFSNFRKHWKSHPLRNVFFFLLKLFKVFFVEEKLQADHVTRTEAPISAWHLCTHQSLWCQKGLPASFRWALASRSTSLSLASLSLRWGIMVSTYQPRHKDWRQWILKL